MFRLRHVSAATGRLLLIYAALPISYIITGRLGLFLAVPPGYATAVFLPAGIAIAAMFMGGAATLPPTFFASLLLNVWIGYSLAHHLNLTCFVAALVIALASVLQAAVGGAVLRRTIGYPAPFDNPRDLVLFLLLSPLFCLTSPSLSISGMWVLGVVRLDELAVNWMTWWIGDTLGVLVALPLMLVIAGQPRTLWRLRSWFVAVPMILCFALFVAIFVRVSSWENEQALLEFRMRSQQLADTMKANFEEQALFLKQLSNVFVNRRFPVDRQFFHELVQPLLKRFPDIQAVEWAPRVPSGTRKSFELAEQAEFPGFAIRERGDSKELRIAAGRDHFYPVTYLEPLDGNESAIGFDLASDVHRAAAIDAAISSGDAITTAPIRLVQERGEQAGVLMIHAVPGDPGGSGIVLVVLRMGKLTATVVDPLTSTLKLRLVDAPSAQPLFEDFPAAVQPAHESAFDFGARRYVVQTAPSAGYVAQRRAWQSWAVLAGGVFGTGLLGALLMLGTGHAYRFESLANDLKENAERTRIAQEAARWGVFEYSYATGRNHWSPEIEALYGLQPGTFEGTYDGWLRRLHADDRDAVMDEVARALETGECSRDFRVVWDDASVHWLFGHAKVFRDSGGRPLRLLGVNVDITRRKQAEERVAADLFAMTRLNEVGSRCVRQESEVENCLDDILETAIAINGSDKGIIQLLDSRSGTLSVAAQRGFESQFLKFFASVRDGSSAYGATVLSAKRVIVEDVMQSEIFAGQRSLDVMRDAEVRAMISTPLVSSAGTLLGMISTHFRTPHRPGERELHLLDLLARQGADYLERKHTEKVLRAREHELELIINRTPFMFTRCSRDLRYRFVSRAYAEMIGRRVEDVAGRSLVEIMGEVGYETIRPYVDRVLQGERAECESEVHFQGVGPRLLRAVYTPEMDERGNVEGWIASILDVTERKRGEQVAQQLASIVEFSDDAIVSADINGIIVSWNRGAQRLFGYSAEDVVSKPITILIPPERQDEGPQILDRVRRGEHIDHYETVRQRKDGGLVDIALTVSPLKDTEGKIVGASKIARDITAHKRVERALRAREAELETVISRTPFMLIRCSPDLRYRFVSPAYAEMLGRRREDVIGRPIVDVIGEQGFKTILPHIKKVLRGERAEYEGEVHYQTIGKRFLHGVYTPDKDDRGEVIGWIGSILDVTERRRAEAQRDLLIAEVNHRVKNTLATVISIAHQSFSEEKSFEDAQSSFNSRIRALAQSHTRLADANWSGISLETIVRDETAPYRNSSNVNIVGPGVILNPKCAVSLGMAIHELTTNAAKYGALSAKTGSIQVSWESAPADREVRITWVERGGPTVNPPQRSGFGRRLLERALASDLNGTVKLDFRKEGLRCLIAFPLNRHTGKIIEQSTVLNPIGTVRLPSLTSKPADRGPSRKVDLLNGIRVLIVEDEALLALEIQELLQSAGSTVIGTFSDLARAEQAARREAIDVAVLDTNLNGEMVYPLADDLVVRGIPFVFVTGYGTSNLPERFRSMPQVAKPFDPESLTDELQRMMSQGPIPTSSPGSRTGRRENDSTQPC
jgi:PAS domain S-box-containing protein